MNIILQSHIFGPLQNNTYLLADPESHMAVIIDPAQGSHLLIDQLKQMGVTLKAIWITHAHFDHIFAVKSFLLSFPDTKVALHPLDFDLWEKGGGSLDFGYSFNIDVQPQLFLSHGQKITLGNLVIEVRHTPGHTPGHVIFYLPELHTAFTGDLIFYHSIGRTDFEGGDFEQLIQSIHTQLFTLPAQTRLLCGHGPETSVQEEMTNNPFV